MLNEMMKLLKGLGDVDNGVECVLTEMAFDGLIGIIKTVYGTHAAEVVENGFTQREDGSLVVSLEDLDESFAICLTGRG